MEEVLASLAQRQEHGFERPEDLQPIIARSLALAAEAPLEKLAQLAETYVALRFRTPIRHLMPSALARLEEQHGLEEMGSVLRLMSATGKAQLFYMELFNFCSAHNDEMSASAMSTYLYEAGRHGLRCRHLMDAAVPRAEELAREMSAEELMRASKGLLRFTRDWKGFYIAAQPLVAQYLPTLSVPQLLIELRVARDLINLRGFRKLHSNCCAELQPKIPSASFHEQSQCLIYTAFKPKYLKPAYLLSHTIAKLWTSAEDISKLLVVEVVDALDNFASWGIRPMALLDKFDAVLLERITELKYAGNVSLWAGAVESFSRLEHHGARWPRAAMGLARERVFVERISFFQQARLAAAIGHLRLVDEAALDNIAHLLVADIGLFRSPVDVGPVLGAYVMLGCHHEALFDRCYDLFIDWFKDEGMDLTQANMQNAMIHVAWCFAAAGYHIKYESFAAFLDYAFHTDARQLPQDSIRHLLQMTDLVYSEAPDAVERCQYSSHISALRSNPHFQRMVSSDPTSEPQLLHEVREALQVLGWEHDAFAMPDETSPYYVDVSLEKKLKQKVGLLVAGVRELVEVAGDGDASEPAWRDSGLLAMRRRCLEARGWRTELVQAHDWANLPDAAARHAFLDKTVQRIVKTEAVGEATVTKA
eukprot:NODE_1186_length_2571_cov_5.209902.p1 GENE.NODE_1186_length_2571_cov_5.209902~~NODE_1186_length_2571_cov_5.209902.p1  ORF type:complete len:748 (-),score=214.72 NODE_1186_length_2571_cov_5.209902:326-2269(-)